MAEKRKRKTEKKGKRKEVVEFFKVEKKGKEKIVKAKGSEIVEDTPSKKQMKDNNKMILKVLLTIGFLIVVFLAVYFFMSSLRHFDYQGVRFDIINEGNLVFYKTSFPVMYEGEEAVYSIFLRNNPHELEKINFSGELNLMENVVVNASENLYCDGDGTIAIANMAKLGIFGIKMVKDNSVSCDADGRYMYLNIKEADESGIEQYGPSCYNLNVNNCEVIEVTEKFMVESFIELEKIKN
ncbi:MAG: hypothetical protein ABIH49_02830 [archaeon]